MEMETNRTKTMVENNQAIISGEIVTNFEFSHEVYGEGFYTAMIETQRKSGVWDIVKIMVSERLVNPEEEWKGQLVEVVGQFRSYNEHKKGKSSLILYVFAHEFGQIEDFSSSGGYGDNRISLDGYICRQPTYRTTPLIREISDILLAVNRPYGKSDYIPIICWGRNARFASGLEIGTRLKVWGRIQSREYQKKISDDKYETRTAYEVSVSKLEILKETEE